MLRTNTLVFIIAGTILAGVHNISLALSLYWTHLWLDIPVHMLGGAVVVFLIFTIHDLFPSFPTRLLLPIPVLLFVLMSALAWEVYEIFLGVPLEQGYEIDTITDLIVGMLGGVIGYIVAYSVSTLDFDHDIDAI